MAWGSHSTAAMRTHDVARVLTAVDPANPLADRRLPYAVMDAALSLASRYDARWPVVVVKAPDFTPSPTVPRAVALRGSGP